MVIMIGIMIVNHTSGPLLTYSNNRTSSTVKPELIEVKMDGITIMTKWSLVSGYRWSQAQVTLYVQM